MSLLPPLEEARLKRFILEGIQDSPPAIGEDTFVQLVLGAFVKISTVPQLVEAIRPILGENAPGFCAILLNKLGCVTDKEAAKISVSRGLFNPPAFSENLNKFTKGELTFATTKSKVSNRPKLKMQNLLHADRFIVAVGGLTKAQLNVVNLLRYFSQMGEIFGIQVFEREGLALVEFATPQAALAAINSPEPPFGNTRVRVILSTPIDQSILDIVESS